MVASITVPPCPESALPLPPDIEAERQTIARAVGSLVERRVAHAEREQSLRDPGAVVDPAQLRAHADEVPSLLTDELALRKRMADHDAVLRRHISAVASRVHVEHEAAQQSVKKALRKIGFLDPVPDAPTPGSWTQEMVLRHPDVLRRLHLSRELSAHAAATDWARGNLEAVKELEGALNRLRTALLRSPA